MAKTKTEAEWAAEYDAQTLAQAEEIKRDPRRLKAAQAAAQALAAEAEAKAKDLEIIADG